MNQIKKIEIQPYEPSYREIAPQVFVWDGEWYETLFRRRMTLIQLQSGGLFVHSPIQLKDEDYAKLDSLGKVSIIVAPNDLHGDEAHLYKLRYPSAKLLVSGGQLKKVSKRCQVDGVLPQDWPHDLQFELQCLEFQGTRLLHENLFFHPSSKTLVTTDLVFHLQEPQTGLTRYLLQLNRVYLRFGPSWIFRNVFVRRPEEAAHSLKRVLEWDFDNVIMSHGQVLMSDGKARLRKGFEEIGIQI